MLCSDLIRLPENKTRVVVAESSPREQVHFIHCSIRALARLINATRESHAVCGGWEEKKSLPRFNRRGHIMWRCYTDAVVHVNVNFGRWQLVVQIYLRSVR